MRHRRIEILILLFIGALIVSVVSIGSITFKKLRAIEKQSEKIYEPNLTLINLKLLLAELQSCENCIRSYSLYKNAEYLITYERSLDQINICINNLYSYQKNNPDNITLLDSTEALVEKKILLLNEQLTLRNDAQVVNELNKVKLKLDKISKNDTVIISTTQETVEPTEKKGNFIRRLFRRKDDEKQTKLKRDTFHVIINTHSIEDIQSEVSKVRKKQNALLSNMKQKELELVTEEKMIWSKLLGILNILENKQNALLKVIALENIRETETTHRLTKIFGVLILIILLILIIFSLYYFYTGKKYREELTNAAYESKMLAAARKNFLANMSHEMRTPLHAITGFTEQLQFTEMDQEQKKQLNIIEAASKHLLRLIDDILDLSKIEADMIQFEKIPFNPSETITEAVGFLKPKALNKNLVTILTIHPTVPNSIIGDPLRLRQAILNLFGNAIKFTNKGEIKIDVSVTEINTELTSKPALCVCVEDSGIGIPPEMLENIFDNFTQADTSITRKYGGTGLGLSITKKIVELQSGEIHIESYVNKGTKLSFKIPYVTNNLQDAKKPESAENNVPANIKGKKVLVADDEQFNRMLLTAILKKWGLQYDEALNGREVIEKLKTNDYDMILMDVRMPDINGIDACIEIRKFTDQKKALVPIIALTAVTSKEKKEKCFAAGMNELITKPYSEKELLKIMERFLTPVK